MPKRICWHLGIYVSWDILAYVYFTRRELVGAVARSPAAGRSCVLFRWLGVRLALRPAFRPPAKAIAFANRQDFIDSFPGLGRPPAVNTALSATQTGRVRNYAAGLVLGAIVIADCAAEVEGIDQ